MNKDLEEIYLVWNNVTNEENVSFQTIKNAENIIDNLDYYPSYVWNTQGNIILEYIDKSNKLFFIIDDNEITGKYCVNNKIVMEYMYLTYDNINTLLHDFWI